MGAILLALGLGPLAFACDDSMHNRVWYVDGDATACPGEGSDEAPFCTIGDAFDAPLEPGDAIRLRSSAEPLGNAVLSGGPSGTAAAPIVVEPDCGHSPVIAGAITLTDVSHWIVRGLLLQGGGARLAVQALTADAENVQLLDNTLYRSTSSRTIRSVGDVGEPPRVRDLVVRGNRVIDCESVGILLESTVDAVVADNLIIGHRCSGQGTFGAHQEGIRVALAVDGASITGNAILDFPDDCTEPYRRIGIRVRQEAAGVVVERNLVRGLPTGSADGETGGISIEEGSAGTIIARNIVVDAGDCALCAGRYFAPPLPVGSTWRHNTVFQSVGIGIDAREATDVLIENNLVVAEQDAVAVFGVDATGTWRDNVYGSPLALPFAVGTEALDFDGWRESCACDADAALGDTAIVDPSLTPAEGSPAIDSGSEGADPFAGSGPDAGALEVPRAVGLARLPGDVPRFAVELEVPFGPLQPAGDCAGLTAEFDTGPAAIVACELVAGPLSSTLELELEHPAAGAGRVTVSYDGGRLVDSIAIGGLIGARVPPFAFALDVELPALPEPGTGSTGGTGTDAVDPDARYPDPDLGCACSTRRSFGEFASWLPLLWACGRRRRCKARTPARTPGKR